METKKNKQADLEHRRSLHFTIGLLLALSVVFVAFEWKYPENPVINLSPVGHEFPPVVEMEVTEINPPKPRVVLPKVVEIPNEEEPDVDLMIQFDVAMDDPIEDLAHMEEPEPEETDEIILFAEEQPSFPGGIAAFYEYIGKQLEYPRQAIQQRTEGKVYVQFVVNKDGSLTDIQVVKGIGAGYDAEAVRVLSSAPPWNPGKQRGKPVRVQMMIPITFQLR